MAQRHYYTQVYNVIHELGLGDKENWESTQSCKLKNSSPKYNCIILTCNIYVYNVDNTINWTDLSVCRNLTQTGPKIMEFNH